MWTNGTRHEDAFKIFTPKAGTPYPCPPSHLSFHASSIFPHSNPKSQPLTTPPLATLSLLSPNAPSRPPSPTETLALTNLTTLLLDLEASLYDWTADLIIKAFADLDTVFFNGKLQGNVCVRWMSAEYLLETRGKRDVYGCCVRPFAWEERHCWIELNAGNVLLRKKTGREALEQMFGTALHEMCHAYELIRCPPPLNFSPSHDSDPDHDHDANFRAAIHAVHRRARRVLGLWAIGPGDEEYLHDHVMSRQWAEEEGKGERWRYVEAPGWEEGSLEWRRGEREYRDVLGRFGGMGGLGIGRDG